MRAAFVALLVVTALAATGCGAVEHIGANEGDASNGKALFSAHCGSCHVLADAETKGAVGPNLDDAFGSDRRQGFDESTIRDVVRGQIAYAEAPMPQKLVVGDDAVDVSAYVAKCAGVLACGVTAAGAPPSGGGQAGGGQAGGGGTSTTETTTTTTAPSGGGGAGGAAQGKQIFTANCGGCHTLKDAGTSGNVGPNLDQAKPPKAKVQTQVTNGGGAMPPFKGTLSPAQIAAVADYVSSAAGK